MYERSLEQCVNFDKSVIYLNSNVEESLTASISTCLRVLIYTDLKRYLGLPNMVGRAKQVFGSLPFLPMEEYLVYEGVAAYGPLLARRVLCIPLAQDANEDFLVGGMSLKENYLSVVDWLLYVFTVSTGAVIREMVCTLVQVYLLKYNTVNEKLPGCLIGVERWRPPNLTCVKVNFDAVFHAPAKTSCAGIVIRDHLGMVMGSQSVVILSWRSARSYRLIMICRPLGLTSEISMQWLCSFAGVDSCMFPELRIRWPICWQLRVSGEGFMLTRREGCLSLFRQ
ncbi:hypothetical protein Goari_012100 [Gossypium aridum]|uniref:Uncharacterized protein n=1 Tax=Gossypium aridum TaxID=34290 RepID=A0A7J8WZX0_GOSAI|nr:hypothetical protein [Gossypium aridum]